MNRKLRIGIDIGGTNTDAVLVDAKDQIKAIVKTTTTAPMETGFLAAMERILSERNVNREDIEAVLVGTTHATNAILEGKDLYKVAVLRLAGHKPATLPPGLGWPESLKKAVLGDVVYLEGGFECDGRAITPFDQRAAKDKIQELLDKGNESVAVCGVFSPLYAEHEQIVENIIRSIQADMPVSLSHKIGKVGFVERENATILNASLKKVMADSFQKLSQMCLSLGLTCPMHVTQNNGSIISLREAIQYPILTISAGPTNSFIGGAKLASLNDAIIVDIGGTSTDLGVIQNSFPRRCLSNSNIGGVNLNFAMPDVLSIALGGGSLISLGDEISIGPKSCARRLMEESLAFGGKQLTLTDIALRLGTINIPGSIHENLAMDEKIALSVMDKVHERILQLVSKIEMRDCKLPVVLVGGGARLLKPDTLPERFQIPPFASVANAYGAALAEIATTVDVTVSLDRRDATLQELKEKALNDTVAKGASLQTTRIVEQQIIPYHYMPGNQARVIVTAAGKP